MRKLLLLIFIFYALRASGQNYQITFAGAGATNIVNTVKVENLTTGIAVAMNGSDILRLNIPTSIDPVKESSFSLINIFPNPVNGTSVVEVFPPVAGDAVISVVEATGKMVFQIKSYLESSPSKFRISGLHSGFYLINVKGNGYHFSEKLISTGKESGSARLEKTANDQPEEKKTSIPASKGSKAITEMPYSPGERLKFTGISGNYSTVKTDVPTGNKTITFYFYPCTDIDNNNYPVVEIGNQVWMEENLKTTKFKDGTNIPQVTDNLIWNGLTTPAYCWYDNDEAANKDLYGAQYNWYTVATGNLCPAGWHVPTVTELTTLTDFFGGLSEAGGKLKETGTSHWLSPNTGATNESGLTNVPGGIRHFGEFTAIGMFSSITSANEFNTTDAWFLFLYYGDSYIDKFNDYKSFGHYVRCLKD